MVFGVCREIRRLFTSVQDISLRETQLNCMLKSIFFLKMAHLSEVQRNRIIDLRLHSTLTFEEIANLCHCNVSIHFLSYGPTHVMKTPHESLGLSFI